MKLSNSKCLKGGKHSVDTWKMARAIIESKIKALNIQPKALVCAIKDLKKANANLKKTK